MSKTAIVNPAACAYHPVMMYFKSLALELRWVQTEVFATTVYMPTIRSVFLPQVRFRERCTYSLVQVLMNQYGVLTIFHPLYLRYLFIRLLLITQITAAFRSHRSRQLSVMFFQPVISQHLSRMAEAVSQTMTHHTVTSVPFSWEYVVPRVPNLSLQQETRPYVSGFPVGCSDHSTVCCV
jgi:hypothetical protein